MKKNKILYTINYDKIVNFKERVTRFTVRFEFKDSELVIFCSIFAQSLFPYFLYILFHIFT